MQKKGTSILCSASDIVSFLDCEHKTTLDFIDLETPLPIQGIHPGRSGESSLDYLLNGMATIRPE